MWRRSFISRNVLFASILLSNALPIFLMATSSRVSEFTAALEQREKVRVETRRMNAERKIYQPLQNGEW